MDQDLQEHLQIKLNKKRNELKSTIRDLSSASKLLQKKDELMQVNNELDNKREEYQLHMERLKLRKNIFEDKEKKLKESLKLFDKFVKDNDFKKQKSLKMVETCKQLMESKNQELENLKNEKDSLTNEKNKMFQNMTKYLKLHNFLMAVVNGCEEFSDMRDVFLMYNHLQGTKLKVLESEQKSEEEMKNIKISLHRYIEDQDNEILNMNNKLLELKSKNEIVSNNLSSKRNNFKQLCKHADDVSIELKQIKLSVKNLYNKVVNHRGINTPSNHNDGDVEGQMMKVKHYLQDLTSIVQEMNILK